MFHLLVPNNDPPFPVQPLTEVQVMGSIYMEKNVQVKMSNTKTYITLLMANRNINKCITKLTHCHIILSPYNSVLKAENRGAFVVCDV